MSLKKTKDEIINEFNNIHGDKYDYSKVEYINATTKVCIICLDHGEFWQLSNNHKKGKGCPICGNNMIGNKLRSSSNKFTKHSKTIHGSRYDYSKVEYIDSHTKVCIICKEHDEFWQTPNHHLNGQGCPKCGKLSSVTTRSSTHNQVITLSNIIHDDFYDYSKVKYINNHMKSNIICPIHGDFWQQMNNHLNGQGCPKCGVDTRSNLRLLTTDEFIKRSKDIHNDKYNYSKVEYIDSKTKVCIICPDHGEFWIRPNNHVSGQGCSKCGSSITISKGETNLSSYLKTLINIEHHDRSIIHPFELDIIIPKKNIAIEYNGNYWHSELNGKNRNYHLNKTKLCMKQNIQLIHIFEDEWINKQSIVKNRLSHILGETKYKIPARKCEIHEITSKKSSQFLNKYHIQGQDRSGIRLGMFYRNRIVAVMTFSKRRFDKKDGYELVRYCTVGSFTVIGGAGKLLKYFERNWNPKSIISYADKRWSNGGLYKTLGFKHTHDSTPNYFYMLSPKVRESRHHYQKHKLHKILDNFDPKLSEWENMKNNGYDRIWDCGNMVFEKLVQL